MASPVKRRATYDDLRQVPAHRVAEILDGDQVYRLADDRRLLLATHEGAARARSQPFDAVEVDLAPLWGEGGSAGVAPACSQGFTRRLSEDA
jgi:hypothetical protein